MKKTILIVDDSSTYRTLLSFTLEKYNYSVIEAENGDDGLRLLDQKKNIDMIISDVNMPIMGGLEMITAIRARNLTIPIVMLTTHVPDDLLEVGRNLGVSIWIAKPIRPREFILEVNRVIGDHYGGPSF